MKIAKFIVLLIVLSLVFISCEESGGDGDGGSVTIVLTANGDYEGLEVLAGILSAGADPATDDPIAVGSGVIPADGFTVEFTLSLESDDSVVWYADKDTAYDLYVFIDNDADTGPSSGDKYTTTSFPKEYSSINSDLTLNVAEVDFGDTIP